MHTTHVLCMCVTAAAARSVLSMYMIQLLGILPFMPLVDAGLASMLFSVCRFIAVPAAALRWLGQTHVSQIPVRAGASAFTGLAGAVLATTAGLPIPPLERTALHVVNNLSSLGLKQMFL